MKSVEKLAFSKLERFVEGISNRDSSVLQREFSISPSVIDEIYESIGDYYDLGVKLSIASLADAGHLQLGGRSLIDFYPVNDGGLGVECALLIDGKVGEAILHAEFSIDGDKCELKYKYIGS
ncbi:hypothetical protein [Pseudomonas oryziphila]|uniref:Uncharacterized protein n=1 Tax=Pseudomonas entomophila TaxID=312306 RepID=A0A3S8UQV3_9PSED|nr:hypothetical protein [Pseudomonas oryziphila]AZL70621.1 hypothetical protein EJA05_24080 [Pseudomonas oryziphila]